MNNERDILLKSGVSNDVVQYAEKEFYKNNIDLDDGFFWLNILAENNEITKEAVDNELEELRRL